MLSLQLTSRLLTHILVAICAIFSAQAGWQIVSVFLAESDRSNTFIPPQNSTETISGSNPSAIIDANLFGKISAVKPKPAPPKKPKVSSLDIKVLGIISGETGRQAVILSYKGKRNSFLTNETLESIGNADISVIAISKDRITINNNGNEEDLTLKNSSQINIGLSTIEQPRPTSTAKAQMTSIMTNQQINLQNNSRIQRFIKNIDQKISARPNFYKRFFSLQTVSLPDETGARGLLVSAGQDKRVLAQTPILPGDIITHLNDKEIVQYSQDEVISLLATNPVLSLQLHRDSNVLTLEIDI